VALGDSFTAGNGCEPGVRWPDLLTADLRLAHPGLEYFNLARDGADSEEVLSQIPQAVSLNPDLITLVCGANDVILTLKPDLKTFGARLELMIDRLRERAPRVAILTATYPEEWRLEGLGPRTREKIRVGIRGVNEVTRQVSDSRRVRCIDVVDHPGIADPANYENDGLHPSAEGHRHAATEFSLELSRYILNRSPYREKWRFWR
jgi:lysophospholipase L1-like esterase